MSLKDIYAEWFHYVSTICISPGRQQAWRASCLIGVAYGLAAVASLTLVTRTLPIAMTSVGILVVAWLVTAASTAAVYLLFRDVAARGGHTRLRNLSKKTVALFAVSVLLVCALTTVFVLVFFS